MFLAFAAVSGNGALKASVYTVAYDLGWRSGLLDRGNELRRNAAVDVCNHENVDGKGPDNGSSFSYSWSGTSGGGSSTRETTVAP